MNSLVGRTLTVDGSQSVSDVFRERRIAGGSSQLFVVLLEKKILALNIACT